MRCMRATPHCRYSRMRFGVTHSTCMYDTPFHLIRYSSASCGAADEGKKGEEAGGFMREVKRLARRCGNDRTRYRPPPHPRHTTTTTMYFRIVMVQEAAGLRSTQ
jgi:hypothetical protein